MTLSALESNRLAAICQFVYLELGKRRLWSACINSAAILVKVLHAAGFKTAFPLTVSVSIANDNFLKWLETNEFPSDPESYAAFEKAGCVFMNVGKKVEGGMAHLNKWDGHLVVIIPNANGEKHLMLDLTIVQMHKPEWGMPMQPLLAGVGDDFVKGERSAQFLINGYTMIYDSRPDDRSYRDDGDLMKVQGSTAAAAEIVRDVGAKGLI